MKGLNPGEEVVRSNISFQLSEVIPYARRQRNEGGKKRKHMAYERFSPIQVYLIILHRTFVGTSSLGQLQFSPHNNHDMNETLIPRISHKLVTSH